MEILMQPWVRYPQRRELQCGDKVHFMQGQRSEHGRIVEIRESVSEALVQTSEGTITVKQDKLLHQALVVAVVAPGAGVGSIGDIFLELDADPDLQVEVVGRKGMPYDRYPECWDSGTAAPNLRSFGEDVVSIGLHRRADCVMFGSRGGQVVLPIMWDAVGDQIPPSVVVNGGCAMRLPGPKVNWPAGAVTVMLLGGLDFFRTGSTAEQYLTTTCQCVSPLNKTTAFLFVPEMKHMPQQSVARVALPALVSAALAWSQAPELPPQLAQAAEALNRLGFACLLRFTTAPGRWAEQQFGQLPPDRQPPPPSPRGPRAARPPCPQGTAVSVLPASLAVADTAARHEKLAEEARQLAGKGDARLREQLLQWADGQDAEAWAAEDDELNKAREKRKPAAPPAQRETTYAVRKEDLYKDIKVLHAPSVGWPRGPTNGWASVQARPGVSAAAARPYAYAASPPPRTMPQYSYLVR
ncbi:unnamed protein product [Effrenium voratum]|uniref:Uncharacterized protein n=1 Tax=Effrenium voratum TaxID=2562239 RepID=A0AA36MP82_9DINO|nr:unnamed protein product [Effrenium voratum]